MIVDWRQFNCAGVGKPLVQWFSAIVPPSHSNYIELMPASYTFTTIGNATGKIPVRLSFKIVELFSEGLYASPNKAIEELVANSFDAGALKVAVMLPCL
jgi:hypothetical protein